MLAPGFVVQPNDSDRRRKFTMERAKANHLARQLQMRLQYAKLKVEHGWQRQSLNEVENLYFHHSHQRGPKTQNPPLSLISTAQPESMALSSFPSHDAQSSLSFKLGSSSLVQSSMDDGVPNMNDGYSHAGPSDATGPDASTQNFPVSSLSVPASALTSTTEVSVASESTSVEVDEEKHPNTIGQETSRSSEPTDVNNSYLLSPKSPSTSSKFTSDHYAGIKPGRPRISKTQSNLKALPALTPQDLQGFVSTSSLSYDSFWSSHTGSPGNQTSRESVGNLLSIERSKQSIGAAGSSLGPGFSFSVPVRSHAGSQAFNHSPLRANGRDSYGSLLAGTHTAYRSGMELEE